MSISDTLPVQLPSDGIKGLAMMAPVVGFPLLLHAVGGVVITGIGFAAVSSFVRPVADRIFQGTKGLSFDSRQSFGKVACKIPVPITVTVIEEVPASRAECMLHVEEATTLCFSDAGFSISENS